LLRILALESVRNRVVLIGEDLGTVQPAIREALERFGVLSYRLLYFERAKAAGSAYPTSIPGRRWCRSRLMICRPWPVSGRAWT
jgi:4-alpha-glucanotransferase